MSQSTSQPLCLPNVSEDDGGYDYIPNGHDGYVPTGQNVYVANGHDGYVHDGQARGEQMPGSFSVGRYHVACLDHRYHGINGPFKRTEMKWQVDYPCSTPCFCCSRSLDKDAPMSSMSTRSFRKLLVQRNLFATTTSSKKMPESTPLVGVTDRAICGRTTDRCVRSHDPPTGHAPSTAVGPLWDSMRKHSMSI